MPLYICQSGEIKQRANQHRESHIQLTRALFQVAESMGAKKASIDYTMMLIRSIHFDGAAPNGWSTPKWASGGSRPKRTAENAEIRKYFTPDGPYHCKLHPDLAVFFDWLKVPHWYEWTHPDGGSGSSSIISHAGIFGLAKLSHSAI